NFQHPLLHGRPNTVVYGDPLPRTGGIAIRASQAFSERFAPQNSALVIVLDCSGSMNETKEGEKETHFKKAKKAIRQEIQMIPEGTKVSLWAFGQKEKTVTEVEDTIKRWAGPFRWSAEQHREALMYEVEKLKPSFSTPLVRAMMEARVDFEGI